MKQYKIEPPLQGW